jgi:hypothetical protein
VFFIFLFSSLAYQAKHSGAELIRRNEASQANESAAQVERSGAGEPRQAQRAEALSAAEGSGVRDRAYDGSLTRRSPLRKVTFTE